MYIYMHVRDERSLTLSICICMYIYMYTSVTWDTGEGKEGQPGCVAYMHVGMYVYIYAAGDGLQQNVVRLQGTWARLDHQFAHLSTRSKGLNSRSHR
jgi:hypothetical protein